MAEVEVSRRVQTECLSLGEERVGERASTTASPSTSSAANANANANATASTSERDSDVSPTTPRPPGGPLGWMR